MAHDNRGHQLEDIANQDSRHEKRYGEIAQAESSSSSSQNGTNHLVPVPATLRAQLGSPTALAIGAFSTTLTTLALSLMEWRGVTTTNVYIGNFFFVAGIGMVISAQWELVLGNTYAYTVLSAFGLFYGGFGAIITPFFGVAASYGTDTAQNLVYIGIFFTVEMAFTLVAASYFATADGHSSAGVALKKAGGAFAFMSGMLGYYTVGNLMCQQAMFFSFPMGDTSRFFSRKAVVAGAAARK
ncbi:MAG: hypothetical protein Q9228_003482 [Teloschistes exilis]